MLTDHLKSNLEVIFCGTAVGKRSAELGHYYSHPGNRFWRVLAETGLTPERLTPQQDGVLPELGIGLTDLVKSLARRDDEIPRRLLGQVAVDRLANVVATYKPKRIAFNGKKAAHVVFGRRMENYGQQRSSVFQDAEIWVLPSTSDLAVAYWDPDPWYRLASAVAADRASG